MVVTKNNVHRRTSKINSDVTTVMQPTITLKLEIPLTTREQWMIQTPKFALKEKQESKIPLS